MSVRLLNN